ncbi:MAG TPA: efflux RND transporter periplasmic adaptor subunit [Rhizomicrobium sp.]|nr:efflux RND transporter periplasmic adaptor subunit [Rhizomicrobium sp.]
MPDQHEMLRYTPPARLKLAGYVAAGVVGLVVVVGLVTRVTASREVGEWTDANALPTVSVIRLDANKKTGDLTLPGNVQAFNSAPIYARVSGYLKKWDVDIGAKVKAGQLLAEIDVPDQDQELAQARADLGTAIANQKLSAQTAIRWNKLAKENAAAPQDVDEKNADLAAKTAAVASAKANVDRLLDLTRFKRITAPFDGTVTSRSVDIGALVTVGAPGTAPLFTVADNTKVRIYVHVPQNYSAQIVPGMKAGFSVPEYPGRTFTATLVATAQAVDTTTGTVLIQLQANNADGRLNAGDYAQVQFNLPAAAEAIRLPASALVFNDNGTAVAVVGRDDRVQIKPITILRDYGTAVEIAGGVTRHDRVIDNPPDSLRAGDKVRVGGSEA